MSDFRRLEMSIDLTSLGDTPRARRDALVKALREDAGMISCDCYAGVRYDPKTGYEIGRWSIDGRKVSGAMEYDL